jgi:hypothetical protein
MALNPTTILPANLPFPAVIPIMVSPLNSRVYTVFMVLRNIIIYQERIWKYFQLASVFAEIEMMDLLTFELVVRISSVSNCC